MKLLVTLRDDSIPEDARDYARERMQHLEKYFERITSAEVILSVVASRKHSFRAEFVAHATRGAILARRAEGLPINDINEFVTLASIVERETGRGDERSRVAAATRSGRV